MNEPWIEKHRPQTLKEIKSHDKITNTLNQLIQTKSFPHVLLYGPPGTGKTSSIMACANEMYGNNLKYMVIELNASDDRGIKVVRDKIKKFVIASSALCDTETKFKLIILDEIDAMTDDAQAILKRIMEQYSDNARFCLICNYINKINPALISRCVMFKFSPLSLSDLRKTIKKVSKKENVKLSSEALNTMIKVSNGDMRKLINILQSASMCHRIIKSKQLALCMGYPSKTEIKQLFSATSISDAYGQIKQLTNKGLCINDLITECFEYVMEKNIIDYTEIIHELAHLEGLLQTDTNIKIAHLSCILYKAINTQEK